MYYFFPKRIESQTFLLCHFDYTSPLFCKCIPFIFYRQTRREQNNDKIVSVKWTIIKREDNKVQEPETNG